MGQTERSKAAYADIAVLIPCYNEAPTIADVVAAIRDALPGAAIHVFDNGSSDDTAVRAQAAGAQVTHEPLRGKGNVMRRMFADIEAKAYLILDGDMTYPAEAAPLLLATLRAQRLDMVVGARDRSSPAFPRGHKFGNRLFNLIVGQLFGRRFGDVFSGYRALSRRFVKTFPAHAAGFEIETEMSIHALELRLPTAELLVAYGERPAGSHSKLRTVRDGLRILGTIMQLFKEVKPLIFFGTLSLLMLALALGLAWPIWTEFEATGLVPRLPTAVLATGMALLSFLSLTCGLILDSVARTSREARRLAYLRYAPPTAAEKQA